MEYNVSFATAQYRLIFDNLFLDVPVPGKAGFLEFCAALQPFGLSADGMTFPSPLPSRLADFVLECAIFNRRASLRISWSWIELTVHDLLTRERPLISVLLDAVLAAVSNGAPPTSTRITLSVHLDLAPQDPGPFLGACLNSVGSGLVPHAAIFNIVGEPDGPANNVARVMFARSLRLTQGIYAEFYMEYRELLAPAAALEKVRVLIDAALGAVGFSPARTVGEGNSL